MGGGPPPARPGAPRKGAIMKDMGRRQVLPVLGDEEIARGRPTGDEPGAGTLVTERGNLPLEALGVHARITGLLAEVVLTQTFVNRFDLPLQATYVFPLPDRAAVTEFRMEAGDRVVEGALRERAQARAAYDEALAAGRMAAIAEEERPGVFTMRVGNLLPGERASVRLVMLGPLPYDQGEATFRFPLVVAPRYIPGAPLGWLPAGDGVQPDTDAVPDASRITPPVLLPGFPSPVRLDLRAEVDPAGLPVGAIRSSLHAIVRSERDGPGGRVRVLQAEPGERLDRDFVLRLQVGSGAVDTSALAVPDQRGEGGTFVLTVMPPPAGAARPRDVALVLDRSGSMAGRKIVAARRAAARLVDSLCERDRLTVLAFAGDLQHPSGLEDGAPRHASDRERFRAVEFLARLGARGGTEMAAALIAALDRVGPRIGTPVVTDLELEADGLAVEPGSVTPSPLPALLAGAPLVVCGRYRGQPEGALALRGRGAGGERWRATVPVAPASDGALAKVWARAHVRDLEDRYAIGTAHDADLERRIVRTSLDFGVLSRFTAFVALDTVVVNRDGRLHRVTQPVEVPQGWAWPAAEPEAVPIPFVEGRGGFLSVDSAVARHAMPPLASRPHLRPAVELPKLRVPPV